MRENKDLSIRWIIQEERTSDSTSTVYASHWSRLGLDDFPPGLDYLVLECGASYGYDVALGWAYRAFASVSSGPVTALRAGLATEKTLNVIKEMVRTRRRRDRVDPKWQEHYQAMTNRANRAEARALKLARSKSYVAA